MNANPAPAPIDSLTSENAHLRTRIAELDQKLQLTQHCIDHAADIIIWTDLTGAIRYANEAASRLLGYTNKELLQLRMLNLDRNVTPEIAEQISASYREMTNVAFEAVLTRKDGTTFSVDVKGSYIALAKQEFAVSFIRDNTARKQQEADLRASEERFQLAFEGSSDGLWDVNMLTGESFYSAQYQRMIGYEPGEFGGTMEAWQRLIHPEDLPRVNAAIQRYLTGESPVYEIEHRIKHKQGHWLWVLNRGKIAAHTLEGQPSRITGTIADITARKKVEEALRFFQSLADAAPDAIVLATLDGHLSYANPTFRTLLGYGDDIVGMEVDRFYLQSAANAKELETLVARTGRWQGVIAHQRKDGSTFEGQVSAFLIHDSENQPLAFASIMRDLTAQIQANYERQQLQEQVIQAQQAALRELSTPLMPISEGIVVMPIIGSIDSARAQMVMETLLEGIAIHDADIAILDITGVKIVDTQVAGALVRTALAAQLLGTRVILSGISPEIAQTLVQIGTDLREMTSKRSMRQAIAYALELRKK